jgi:two-component system, OmpR family, heavy metal sensor histidine kinase CusS
MAEAELASVRERSPQEYRASLRLIRAHAQDLQRVLETLLASARAEARPKRSASDARGCAERAAAPLREAMSRQGKSIELLGAEHVRAAVEPDVLERILSPLLENAARFARQRITLEISRSDGEVIFRLRDDGPGVEPDERERIFEPGFGSHHVPPDGHAGAGLGLALVRRLARAAGGEVQAETSSDGASFAVRLPAA